MLRLVSIFVHYLKCLFFRGFRQKNGDFLSETMFFYTFQIAIRYNSGEPPSSQSHFSSRKPSTRTSPSYSPPHATPQSPSKNIQAAPYRCGPQNSNYKQILSARLYSIPDLCVSFLKSIRCVVNLEGIEHFLVRIVIDVL